MIGASYKINVWGNWIIVLWIGSFGCLFVSLWVSFPEFRELVRDIHTAYHHILNILGGINV